VAFLLALQLGQRFVRTITQGLGSAVFATAKIHRLGFFGVVFHRGERAAFVRTIAKWLRLALAAGAPVVIFARLHIAGVRGFLGDMGFHGLFLLVKNFSRTQATPWYALRAGYSPQIMRPAPGLAMYPKKAPNAPQTPVYLQNTAVRRLALKRPASACVF
jgi:hypothetical protein